MNLFQNKCHLVYGWEIKIPKWHVGRYALNNIHNFFSGFICKSIYLKILSFFITFVMNVGFRKTKKIIIILYAKYNKNTAKNIFVCRSVYSLNDKIKLICVI